MSRSICLLSSFLELPFSVWSRIPDLSPEWQWGSDGQLLPYGNAYSKMKWNNAHRGQGLVDCGKHYFCTTSAGLLLRFLTCWNKGHLHIFFKQRTFACISPADFWWNIVIWKAHGGVAIPHKDRNQMLEYISVLVKTRRWMEDVEHCSNLLRDGCLKA